MTTIFGIICFFFMPHTPADAKFLTEEERGAAMFRLRQDAHGATDIEDVNEEKFDWRWVRMALKAPQTWLSSLIWFFVLIPLYVSLRLEIYSTAVNEGLCLLTLSRRASHSFCRRSLRVWDTRTRLLRSFSRYLLTWQLSSWYFVPRSCPTKLRLADRSWLEAVLSPLLDMSCCW